MPTIKYKKKRISIKLAIQAKFNKFDYNIINEIVTKICEGTEAIDENIIEKQLIPKYGWEYIQQALFTILLNNNSTTKQYEEVANAFWDACIYKRKIKKTTVIALLYYRLGNIDNPYENNLIWSITSKLLNLDYCNAEYNPLMDKKIIRELASHGVTIKK